MLIIHTIGVYWPYLSVKNYLKNSPNHDGDISLIYIYIYSLLNKKVDSTAFNKKYF